MRSTKIPLRVASRIHTYHAEANLFEMELKTPVVERVRPQGKVELYGSGERSHYQFKHEGPFRLEGIASYQSGYTQVAGSRSLRHERQPFTLATSVVEGLNILEVFTADRVVAQISTAHPTDGSVPEISFTGTRFENLRIAGHKVELDMNLEILGARPVDDQSYFDNRAVMDRIEKQYLNLSNSDYFPDWATERYPRDLQGWKVTDNGADIAKCSLINNVHSNQRSFGHVIEVPHYGKFFLGELKVRRDPHQNRGEYDSYTFSLSLVRIELGSVVTANGAVGTVNLNGQGSVGTHTDDEDPE
jgi:hypothetical protein